MKIRDNAIKNKAVYKKAMKTLKLERFFDKQYDDEICPVGLNPYMKNRVDEITSNEKFVKYLPAGARKLSHEQIQDLKNYRQAQIAASVQDTYEASHLLLSGVFSYKRAADILISKISGLEFRAEKNHLKALSSNIKLIIENSQTDRFGLEPKNKIQLDTWQRASLEKQIEYIESLRSKDDGHTSNNS